MHRVPQGDAPLNWERTKSCIKDASLVPSMYLCLSKVNRATLRKPVSLEKEICPFFLHHKVILWFISSICFLPHSTPNTLVFLLFLESGKHVPNSEHLHNLFSLCRIPCPTVSMPSSLNHFIPLLKPHLLLEDFLFNYFIQHPSITLFLSCLCPDYIYIIWLFAEWQFLPPALDLEHRHLAFL